MQNADSGEVSGRGTRLLSQPGVSYHRPVGQVDWLLRPPSILVAT